MNKKNKILVVDDNKINLLIAEKLLLSYNYEIETACSGKEALSKIKTDSFDLVIMDIVMPEMDGFKTSSKIKELDPSILIIMLTGLTDDKALHKSFASGAVDFIKKPIHKMELYVRVKNALRIRNAEKSLKKALSSLEEKNKQLEVLADTDGLTNLYNHRYLITALSNNINIAKRYLTPLSIIMFDIDYFKQVNDTHGHLFGDTILKSIADIFIDNLRNVDIIGRYGGEEFLIIQPNTKLEGCIKVAKLLRKQIEKKFSNEHFNIPVTISGGACEYKDDYDLAGFISVADQLLYKAKDNGRNRVEF
jgi:diguanylate cyclase (GGDEF)-like protein